MQITKMLSGILQLSLASILLYSSGSASKIESKIYKVMNEHKIAPCILLTNATHQVGCTSNMDGNRGILHLVSHSSDLDWLINVGPNAPYIPLLNSSFFNKEVMDRLMDSKKISGALVMYLPSTPLPQEFSPDPKCPLENFGMYSNQKEYSHCKKTQWNPMGNDMSKLYFGIPIFAMSDAEEISAMVKCYHTHNQPANGSLPTYPLCGVELKDFMFAAKDTPTCRRKTEMYNPIQSTYCDPLGDNNIYGSLFPLVGEVKQDEIIMVSARLDSTAFFHDFAPSADGSVTGIVTLLAAAHALGDYKRYLIKENKTEDLKPILFTLFNGEVWDYIGSSKMVYDMERGSFPYPNPNKYKNSKELNDSVYTSKFDLKNIGYFLELTQVGLGDTIYSHADPVSMEKGNGTREKIDIMLDYLKRSMNDSSTPFKSVNRTYKQPLPPASFQRFLRSRPDIPGIVLADHEKEFANKFYNSRFDNQENIGLYLTDVGNASFQKINGPLVMKLTKLSEAVANTLYLLASGGIPPKEKIVVHHNLTGNLLYCLMYSANCPGFKEVNGKPNAFPTSPLSRYVSVLQIDNPITFIIHHLLSYYIGEWLPEKECAGKSKPNLPKALSYITVPGRDHVTCVKASVFMTQAVSPAFELQDYSSTIYSTWAESMWNADVGIQMYLVASSSSEGLVLTGGLLIFVSFFGVVYFINKKSDILFTPDVAPVQ